MHEFALMKDLMREIHATAAREGATSVVAVKVRLGALSHMTPSHFREHFEDSSRGGIAAGARVDVDVASDINDPWARDVILESVEVG